MRSNFTRRQAPAAIAGLAIGTIAMYFLYPQQQGPIPVNYKQVRFVVFQLKIVFFLVEFFAVWKFPPSSLFFIF